MKNAFFTKSNILILALFFITFFCIWLWSAPSSALTTGGVGAYPANPDPAVKYSESWFIYNLDLGESKQDALLITNTTNESQTMKVYAVDAIPSNQGNFALKKETDPKVGIGAWIQLSESLVTLGPNEQREIPFTITIPENADVGEHAGGIVIQKVQAGAVEAQTGAAILTRLGVRVYQTVPGEIIKNIELVDFGVKSIEKDVGQPYYEISLTALNKSNVSLEPLATLEIGGWGKVTYSDLEDINIKSLRLFFTGQAGFPVKFFTGTALEKQWQLLRGQQVTTRWEWPKPKFGRFTFQVKLDYEGIDGPKTIRTKTQTLWVIPWTELTVLFVIVLVALALTVLKKTFFGKRGWKEYRVKKGDQLAALAEAYHIGWKRLAKLNKLKTPLLKEGQKIFVPSQGRKIFTKKKHGEKNKKTR